MQRKNWLEGSTGEAMTLQLEDFGSVGILKVLRIVAKYGPLNISLLTRKADMNHSSVDRHVKKLSEMGLVYQKRYGQIRMIKPAFNSFNIQFKKGLDVKLKKS